MLDHTAFHCDTLCTHFSPRGTLECMLQSWKTAYYTRITKSDRIIYIKHRSPLKVPYELVLAKVEIAVQTPHIIHWSLVLSTSASIHNYLLTYMTMASTPFYTCIYGSTADRLDDLNANRTSHNVIL
jgi:hypothetical protein